jgi:hypothetical protein
MRVLGHLGNQEAEWSNEDHRRFVSVAQELTRFLRAHMRLEQREVFEPAARRLSAASKASLALSFARFDADAADAFENARRRIQWLVDKYVTTRGPRDAQRSPNAAPAHGALSLWIP